MYCKNKKMGCKKNIYISQISYSILVYSFTYGLCYGLCYATGPFKNG
jgi:hypothetical protein